MTMYFKVTNSEENHNGFQYVDGLNESDLGNNDNGLSFDTKENICNWYDYGVNLRVIELPDDDPDFRLITSEEGLFSNKLILKEKYSLAYRLTYQRFDLPIDADYASKYGFIDLLKYLEESGSEICYSECAIDGACANGHIHILNWWKEYTERLSNIRTSVIDPSNQVHKACIVKRPGTDFRYTEEAIDLASENGHVDVLNWCKNAGFEFLYTFNAIDHASKNGYINVLNWWKDSNFDMYYTDHAIDFASENGHIDVLDWWKQSGCKIRYSKDAFNNASANGHVGVLNWWKLSGFKLKYSEEAFCLARKNGHDNVLNWWKNNMN